MVPLLVLLFSAVSESANILMLHPIYCGSHEFVLRQMGDQLVSRGHEVTQIRYKQTNSHSNLKTNVSVLTLDIEDSLNNCGRFVNKNGSLDINKVGAKILWNDGHSVLGLPTDIFCLTDAHCQTLFNSKVVSRLLNETSFDLVIIDYIGNECSIALAASLEIPMVGFWGFTYHGGEVAYTSAFNPPSIQPAFFSGLQRKMNFLERVYNFMLHIFHRFYADYQTYYASHYVRTRFPQLPPLDRIVNDFDLVFTNTNPFVSFPQLLPPNVKEIGGIHIPTETPPLPKAYQDFVAGAKAGVILFSLGYTGFSAKDVPPQVVKALLDAFSALDQRVIMRFDPNFLPYVPSNVMVSNWVPQIAILGHPKTVAFFSHCGMSGVIESVYYGVPLLAVGIFADQVDNAAMVEELGVAKRIQKTQLSHSDEILKALRSLVVSHSRYRQRAKEVSSMWRHWRGLVSPQENFVFWIETLLRHGGNLSHLKIEDNDLSLWQYFSLDVILFIGCLLAFKVAAMSWLLKKIWYLSIKNAATSDGGIKKFKAQ